MYKHTLLKAYVIPLSSSYQVKNVYNIYAWSTSNSKYTKSCKLCNTYIKLITNNM